MITPHLVPEDLPQAVIDELALFDLTVADVDRWLRAHGSDGATGVPDGYLPAAWLHDYCYRTAIVPRETADVWYRLTLLHVAESEEWLWRWLAVARAWWRWAALRIVGARCYRSDLLDDA